MIKASKLSSSTLYPITIRALKLSILVHWFFFSRSLVFSAISARMSFYKFVDDLLGFQHRQENTPDNRVFDTLSDMCHTVSDPISYASLLLIYHRYLLWGKGIKRFETNRNWCKRNVSRSKDGASKKKKRGGAHKKIRKSGKWNVSKRWKGKAPKRKEIVFLRPSIGWTFTFQLHSGFDCRRNRQERTADTEHLAAGYEETPRPDDGCAACVASEVLLSLWPVQCFCSTLRKW